jgi:hypothetical protein
MEYLKQFEMNKIGLFNKHMKLPKKVYTCKWYILISIRLVSLVR